MIHKRLLTVHVFPDRASFFSLALPVTAQQSCFTAETRANAERTAKSTGSPNPDYDPVSGL